MGERRQINGLGVRARLDINSGGRERGRRHIAAYHRDLESDHCGIDDLGLIRSLLAIHSGKGNGGGACVVFCRSELQGLVVHVEIGVGSLGGADGISAFDIRFLAGADANIVIDVDFNGLARIDLQFRCLGTQRGRKDTIGRYLDERGGGDVVFRIGHRVRHGSRL